MEYVRTAAPVIVQLFGPDEARHLLHLTGKLIGMQFFDEIAPAFSADRGTREAFATFLQELLVAQGDETTMANSGGILEITQQSWKVMSDVADYQPACAGVLEGLCEGLAAACGRRISLRMRAAEAGRPPFVWSIG